MSEQESKIQDLKPQEPTQEKPGFFGRIFQKLDDNMKAKADEAAKNQCCSDDDRKGGKCC